MVKQSLKNGRREEKRREEKRREGIPWYATRGSEGKCHDIVGGAGIVHLHSTVLLSSSNDVVLVYKKNQNTSAFFSSFFFALLCSSCLSLLPLLLFSFFGYAAIAPIGPWWAFMRWIHAWWFKSYDKSKYQHIPLTLSL